MECAEDCAEKQLDMKHLTRYFTHHRYQRASGQPVKQLALWIPERESTASRVCSPVRIRYTVEFVEKSRKGARPPRDPEATSISRQAPDRQQFSPGLLVSSNSRTGMSTEGS